MKILIYVLIVLLACSCKTQSCRDYLTKQTLSLKIDSFYLANPNLAKYIQELIMNEFTFDNIAVGDLEWRGKVYVELFYNKRGEVTKCIFLTHAPTSIEEEVKRCIQYTNLGIDINHSANIKVITYIDLTGCYGNTN